MSTQVTPKKFYADLAKQDIYICVEVDALDDHRGAIVGLVKLNGFHTGSFTNCWESTITNIGETSPDFLYYTDIENLVEYESYGLALLNVLTYVKP
jgi:hypothetical protein